MRLNTKLYVINKKEFWWTDWSPFNSNMNIELGTVCHIHPSARPEKYICSVYYTQNDLRYTFRDFGVS